MRDHLATLIDDFRGFGREIAVVRYQGNRRRVTSYGEIAVWAGRFAALLVARGVEPGDRMVLWGENSAEWIAAFLGCMLRGVLAVPLDANGTADFATRVAADVSPKLIVADAALMEKLSGLPAPGKDARIWFEDFQKVLPVEEAGPVADLSDATPLQILFTSGTTGDPKGVVLTHGNVLASMGPIEEASKPYLRYERLIHPLRILHTLPLSHVFGQTMGLWVPHIYRAELHFESRLVAARLVDTIRSERISVLAAVPRVHALLKTHLEATLPGLAERAETAHGHAKGIELLKRWWKFRDVHRALGFKFWALISGGGALPGPLENFWNAVGLVLVQGYGMTETTALITLNHPFHVAQGTIGKPLAGREVKLGPDGEVLVRGASISSATWSGGAVHQRTDEWLATGDLAETESTGELKFLGRKSEIIVTANGLNIHPEDLEAVIEQEPTVAACAVVPVDTPSGPEACAVVALRGPASQASAAIEHANEHLAEFQRLRRFVVWPEPDLPRTSSGKVRRKAVSAWMAEHPNGAGANGTGPNGTGSGQSDQNGAGAKASPKDWLLTLIAQITGEAPPSGGDELLLSEDLHLDSLGRVQLSAAIEERMGTAAGNGLLDQVRTVGELRKLLTASPDLPLPQSNAANGSGPTAAAESEQTHAVERPQMPEEPKGTQEATAPKPPQAETRPAEPPPPIVKQSNYIFPHWPWFWLFRWIRVWFIECILRPLVWLLGKPRVRLMGPIAMNEPMLVISNHVVSVDGALVVYGLPGPIRRRLSIAMSGEILEDFRHWRNGNRRTAHQGFFPIGPLYYFLVTEFFNVFPLHRQRDFQRSFAHAGEALDNGFNVLVFPEGELSPDGKLGRFRPGIGLLARQSDAPVLPIALRGAGELHANNENWFRSGKLEIRIGKPIRFSPLDTETTITARLQAAVQELLTGG
jgi:long-chain acyl-CoA synthetase